MRASIHVTKYWYARLRLIKILATQFLIWSEPQQIYLFQSSYKELVKYLLLCTEVK